MFSGGVIKLLTMWEQRLQAIIKTNLTNKTHTATLLIQIRGFTQSNQFPYAPKKARIKLLAPKKVFNIVKGKGHTPI